MQVQDTFKEYQLSEEIIETLRMLGYNRPTRIQREVIGEALNGRDIVGRSQTGSGKTAAFGIPLCQQAVWEENAPGALVLEPTRELTVQVKEELFNIGRKKRLKVPDVFGGFPIDKQIQTLKQKSHIVVGTPGRLMDHIRRGTINLENIHTVVVDEADLMLDMGFIGEVEEIFAHLPRKCQRMLFSATIGERIEKLIEEYLVEPKVVLIEEEEKERSQIRQKLYEVSSEEKYQVFLDSLMKENPDSCMIFCGTKEMVNVLCRKLRKDGVKCGMIHGDLDQQDRLRTIHNFRHQRFRYLIATDVVARGIDFDQLTHVFQYDFPTGRETYVHRIGRTGRNGAAGTAVCFVTEEEQRMRQMVESYLQCEIPVEKLSPVTEEEKSAFLKRQEERIEGRKPKSAVFHKTITKLSIGGGKKSKMRAGDIVGTICSLPDVTQEDIGIIDVRDSLTYVEILNGKGKMVCEALQNKTIKGKLRKVRITRN